MRKRLISLFTVTVLVVSACNSSTSTPTVAPTVAPTAVPTAAPTGPAASPTEAPVVLTGTTYKPTTATHTGGTVVIGESQYPDTLNIYYADAEADVEVDDGLFDSLVILTNDLKYSPDIATNVPTVDNGGVVLTSATTMDVTWNLKPGAEWSDGTPITCNDLEATWQWNMDPANVGLVGGTSGWENIGGIDGGTGSTCVVHFNKIPAGQTTAIFEGYLTLITPMPAAYLKSISVADAATKLYPMDNLKSGVYSGPYIPTQAKADAQITLVANPKWQTISGHAPSLDSVIWKYYGDPNSEIAGFKAGEIDVAEDLNNGQIPALAGIDPSQQVIKDSLTYELNAYNNPRLLSEYGTDWTTIVKAVKMATDRQQIAAGPLGGNVTVSNNYISPLTWYYKDEGSPKPADPTGAQALLTAAGWTKGSDGYLAKAGKTLSLEYCSTTAQTRVDTLKMIASQLKAIGIKVVANNVKSSVLFASWNDATATTDCNLAHGTFDVAEFAWVAPLDPQSGYYVYVSTQTPKDSPGHSGQNDYGVNIPALDQAFNTIKTTVDFAKVRDAMYTIQDIYTSDQNNYELPLYYRKNAWLVAPRVQNFTGNPGTGAGEWNIGDWWVTQ
jgi:peptide/nickel transport system substrate-binding protein